MCPSIDWQGSSASLPGCRICYPHRLLLLLAFVVNVCYFCTLKNECVLDITIKSTNITFGLLFGLVAVYLLRTFYRLLQILCG